MTLSTLRSGALLLVAGGAFVASAVFGSASALADNPNTVACQPGQVVIDGQCASAPTQNGSNTAPPTDHSSDSSHGH